MPFTSGPSNNKGISGSYCDAALHAGGRLEATVVGGNARVAPSLEEVQGELILRVDDPYEEEAVSLQLGNRKVLYVSICQLAVSQGHPFASAVTHSTISMLTAS